MIWKSEKDLPECRRREPDQSRDEADCGSHICTGWVSSGKIPDKADVPFKKERREAALEELREIIRMKIQCAYLGIIRSVYLKKSKR